MIFVLPRVAFGFIPVSDNPYVNMYAQTSNMELLVLYNDISVLEQKYNAALAREQSLANRILGAAAIGAGGIGGMQMASALAEQRADENAMRDMTAYIATFRCNYGTGMTVAGGKTNVQLPSADILLPLYTEYITLAADLKVRKSTLEMPAGIESEIVQNATEFGLYDNISIGKTGGAYTSLSRALMDKDGDDAATWAAQQSATASQLKTGVTVGGAGVIGSAVGNVLINNVFGVEDKTGASDDDKK